MKKAIITFFITLFASSSFQGFAQSNMSTSYASSAINWNTSFADAQNQAQTSSKPILLLFTGSTWCPACMQLERQVLSRPEFAQAVGNKFVFFKADFDPSEDMSQSPNKSLFDRYKIQVFPTMIVVDANGQRISEIHYQTGGSVQHYTNQLLQYAKR